MITRPSPEFSGRVVDAMDRACAYWLGYARPPVAQAMRHAGWHPDAPQQYCLRCGDSVGPGESTADGCASCRDATPPADAFVRLGPYVDELREWILAIKYERWTSMAVALGKRLGEAVEQARIIDPQRAVIVPMPMPWQRRVYRGIDHAHVIATGVSAQLGAPVARVLTKTHGPPQVTLTSTDRQRLGGKNLRVRRRLGGWPMQGLHAIVVDDIRTTGTTMRRAVRLLRNLDAPPAKIIAAVLAVSDPSARHIRRQRRELADAPSHANW